MSPLVFLALGFLVGLIAGAVLLLAWLLRREEHEPVPPDAAEAHAESVRFLMEAQAFAQRMGADATIPASVHTANGVVLQMPKRPRPGGAV